jgi:1,4-dihydroxy-2-naphthoate octaprenyltransferase
MASRYRTFLNIIKLGRLRFLWLGYSLYMMGALLAVAAGASFSLDRFIFGYIVLIIGHLSVHYRNDYYDYEVDSRTTAGTLSGGSGILPSTQNYRFLQMVRLAGPSLGRMGRSSRSSTRSRSCTWFAIFGNLISCYTAPPVRLAYRGLGEVRMIAVVSSCLPSATSPSTGRFRPCS